MRRRPELPFAPRAVPFFYGWIVLAVGTLSVVMSAPGQTAGVSAFTDFLIRDLGVTRSGLSLAYLIGTLTSATVLTSAGRMYDRFGARPVGGTATVVLALILPGLTLLTRAPAALAPVLLTIGFFVLRLSGQGVLALVGRNMVAKWFERRRGLAQGVVGMATTLSFSSAPLAFNAIIGATGWQQAWLVIGLVVGGPFLVVFLLFARDNPQECGLQPDGPLREPAAHSEGADATPRPVATPKVDATLPEARRTANFWISALTISLASMYFTGLTFHVVSIFGEQGIARDIAVAVFIPSSLVAVVVNLVAGWLSDRIESRWLIMAQALGIAISTVAVLRLGSPGAIVILAAGNGLNGGLFGINMAVPWPRYFGLTHLGAISGFAAALTVAGSALGPYAFALVFEYLGSYSFVAWMTLIAAVALVLLTTRMRPTAS